MYFKLPRLQIQIFYMLSLDREASFRYRRAQEFFQEERTMVISLFRNFSPTYTPLLLFVHKLRGVLNSIIWKTTRRLLIARPYNKNDRPFN